MINNKEKLQEVVFHFEKERLSRMNLLKKFEETNRDLRNKLANMAEQVDEESIILKERIGATGRKLHNIKFQNQNFKTRIKERDKNFLLTVECQAEELGRIRRKILRGIDGIARRIVTRELGLLIKFRARQSEIKAIVRRKKEHELKQRMSKVERSLEDIGNALIEAAMSSRMN